MSNKRRCSGVGWVVGRKPGLRSQRANERKDPALAKDRTLTFFMKLKPLHFFRSFLDRNNMGALPNSIFANLPKLFKL